MPLRKVNSTQWPTFRIVREYIQICTLYKKLYVIPCSFSCKNCHVDCRKKLNLIKSERLASIYWRKSLFVYTSGIVIDETLKY